MVDPKSVYTVLTEWLRPRVICFRDTNQRTVDRLLSEGRLRFEAMVRNRYEESQQSLKGRLGLGPTKEEMREFLLMDDEELGTSPYWTCFDRANIDKARRNVEWAKKVLERCGRCGLQHRVRVRHEELMYLGM